MFTPPTGAMKGWFVKADVDSRLLGGWERRSCSHKGAVESRGHKVIHWRNGEQRAVKIIRALMWQSEPWLSDTFGTICYGDARSCLGFPDFFETQLLRFNLDFLAAHAETASWHERTEAIGNKHKQTRLQVHVESLIQILTRWSLKDSTAQGRFHWFRWNHGMRWTRRVSAFSWFDHSSKSCTQLRTLLQSALMS